MTDDGADLLAAARAGDPEAISRLYRDLQPRLLRVLRVDVGDAAEDVASQVWLEVVRGLGRFDGDLAGFRALLFTIARRRVADHRRTIRRRPATLVAPEALEVDGVGGVLDVEALAVDGLASDHAVRFIVEVLSPDQAEVVLLRVVGGLGADDVARVLGRNPGAIRVQQHRALKKLERALRDQRERNETAGRGDEDEQ